MAKKKKPTKAEATQMLVDDLAVIFEKYEDILWDVNDPMVYSAVARAAVGSVLLALMLRGNRVK